VIRVLSVFGTRPEAVKMAPVVRALAARPADFESLVCVSAQHRGLLDQVLEDFALRADFDLDLMRAGQSPAEVASRVLAELPPLLRRVRPDVVLVQGDTTTTFATAFASFLERTPVGHVEAGLRTGNLEQPFPEELNRVLTTRAACLHFAPTEGARTALLAEGVPDADVRVTGNTVIDALLQTVSADYAFRDPVLRGLDARRRVVLVTTHRRESFGAPLGSICAALATLARRRWDCDFVIPVHPNPRVRAALVPALEGRANVHLLEPLGYREFVQLMARAHLILTDSGGIQEEAPALGVPVLVLRETTERPEAVAAGAARLVGTDETAIVRHALELLGDRAAHARMAGARNPYGDGRAAERIAEALLERFAGDLWLRAEADAR
jgi:UDP-N-acetylglucosamine 2-epimerase (non-hydrolysing)